MKRSEKRVLTAILEKPCTLAELMRLRLPAIKIEQACHALVKSGDIQFDGTKFHIKKIPSQAQVKIPTRQQEREAMRKRLKRAAKKPLQPWVKKKGRS